MSNYIPQEVWIDILTKLPIETLIRCISVSKSWYSLITTPTFISQHLNRTTVANNDLLLVRNYSDNSKKEHYSLHFDNHTFDAYKTLDFPFITPNHYFRVIGCSNGLLCLSDDQFCYNHTMILWNPSIRKYVNLPCPRVTFNSHGPFMHSIGFGFNVANNDYKLVRVVHLQEPWGYKAPPEVEIYELSTGSWRSVNPMGFPYVVGERNSQVFLNRVVHWVGHYPNELGGPSGSLIVSFDMGNEVFGVIMVPEGLSFPPLQSRVAVLEECLSMIHFTWSLYGDTCCVWAMKQYGVPESWTKQFTVDLKEGLRGVFGFRKNGEALMKKITSYREIDTLVSYDPKSEQVKNLGVTGSPISFYVDNFVESLVLLDLVNGEFGRQPNCGEKKMLKGKWKIEEEHEEQVVAESEDQTDERGKL